MDTIRAEPTYQNKPEGLGTSHLLNWTSLDVFTQSNLTNLQLLYWIAQKLRPESPFLSTILVYSISGPVDTEVFPRAFRALVGGSDALRTVIREVEGVPKQEVLPQLDASLELVDFSEYPDPEAEFQDWLNIQRAEILDLSQRLFSATLVKLKPDCFRFTINQHHIITDASSMFLTFRFLAENYQSILDGQEPDPARIPSFSAYLSYEHRLRNSGQFQRAETFLKRKFPPSKDTLAFYHRPGIRRSTRVQRRTLEFDSQRSGQLRSLARQEGIYQVSEEFSVYNLLAALFFVQLHLMTGSQTLSFITPIHNRSTEKFRDIIGPVMELCPIRVEISQPETMNSLIQKVKKENRDTLGYYQAGSAFLLQNRGYEVMFNMHPMPEFELDGCRVNVDRFHPGHGSEVLVLHINNRVERGTFEFHFDFHTDIFSASSMDATLSIFSRLLDELLEDRERPIQSYFDEFPEISNLVSMDFSAEAPGEQLGEEGRSVGTQEVPIAPRDYFEHQLVQIWQAVLGRANFGVRDDFFSLGGDSIGAVSLFMRVQEVFGITLPLSTLFEATTIEAMAATIRNTTGLETWSPIKMVQAGKGRAPFFCVPGAGNSPLIFRKLANYIGKDQPFYAFQPKGIYGEAEPFESIEAMASHYVQALCDFQPDGPYLLGGYSFGGLVAFEMARQLRRQGKGVAMLALLDVPAQGIYLKHINQVIWKLGALFHWEPKARERLYLRTRHYIFRLRFLRRRTARENIDYFRQKASRLWSKTGEFQTSGGGAAAAGNQGAGKNPYFLQAFEKNLRIYQCYVPEELDIPITLIRSEKGYKDPDLDYSYDPHLGWRRAAKAGITVDEVPGDHDEMIREPYVQVLAQALRSRLDGVIDRR